METKLYNKIKTLFPELLNYRNVQQALGGDPDLNQDGNGNYLPSEKYDSKTDTLNLLSKLSEKWIDEVAVNNGIIDEDTIQVTEQINMSVGNPVINVEVTGSKGYKMDGHDFTGSGFGGQIAQVRLHRFHCDFSLYDTDIMYGYGMENKIQSGILNVLHGIKHHYLEYVVGKHDASTLQVIQRTISPVSVAELSGAYSSPDKLYINSGAYAKLLANSVGKIDPTVPGALGWNKIIRFNDIEAGLGDFDAVGTFAGNIIGVAGYQSFDSISAYVGNSVAVRDLGTINKIPFVAILSFDAAKMAINCSIQAWVGFAVGLAHNIYAIKDDGTEASTKVEVVNTVAKPVNTKAVTA